MAERAENQDLLLRSFFDRRHPAYGDLLSHWLFLEETYRGGRRWFQDNIAKYYKEGETEFTARLNRAYRFNHTREVVELVQKYLFKAKVTRNAAAPQVVADFWKKATLNGLDIDQLMRMASVSNSISGRCAVVVDNNFPVEMVEVVEGEGESKPRKRSVSVAEAKERNFRIYAYVVPAKDVLDYAFDEDGDGELLWVKLRERVRDDADPLYSSGDMIERVRLWTRDGWQVYEEIVNPNTAPRGKKEPEKKVVLKDSGSHDLGRVPVILSDHTIGHDPYRVPGLIDDIAYLDRAIANYLSNLDAIIQDQTFSQLAIPAQSIMPGEDIYQKVLEMGTKRVFAYDGGAGSTAVPVYLSPDPKQAHVILSVINKIINEIYHTIGLAGERTKEDNAVGIDNSSGVAKAYDFERVNSLLLSKAQACERVENEIVDLVLAWAGEAPAKDKLVTYPTTFDVMRLVDDLVTAEALAKLGAPSEVRREQMRSFIDKLFPQLKKELRDKIEKDIEKWLDEPDLALLKPPTAFGAKPAASPNRQGEVTASTPQKKET